LISSTKYGTAQREVDVMPCSAVVFKESFEEDERDN
jgi:hypothetical protein